ncbi:MAG: sensor histidine kinase [Lachnospiraceae bacterium]|nr:sensor histidine kinase [Lachnospiraceae bacterium]
MDNIRLKHKLALLFLVCVIIPLVVTNSGIFWSMRQGLKKEQEQKKKNVASLLESELRERANQQITLADYLNRNEKLKRFLNQTYKDPSHYYESYVQLMEDDVIHYYYLALSAYNITICTENSTIINGTFFVKKENVQSSSWYRAYAQSNRQVCLYSYFEDGEESAGYIEKGRKLVAIQKLDYCGEGNIILLDLDYQSLSERIEMFCDGIGYCLCVGDKILFSSLEKNDRRKDFLQLSEAQKEEYPIAGQVELYGTTISIRLKQDNFTILDALHGQEAFMLFLYTVNFLLPTFYIYILYRSLYDRVAATQEYLERIKEGVYEAIPLQEAKDEIGSMIQSYNLMVARIKDLVEVVFKNKEQAQSLEIAKKQAELHALQSQLNPHFIFNALETIRMHSILKKEAETARILESFAILMRNNIQWNKDVVTVEEECGNVRRYLEIQKYRFGERLEFFLYIQESCQKCRIPRFMVINFVENACVHGIENNVGGGSITVMVSEDDSSLYVEIMDKGSGMEPQALAELKKLVEQADVSYIQHAQKSIGIVNTVVRMKQYYGEGISIDMNSTIGGGTEISIQVPREGREGYDPGTPCG